ncbi:Uncharacterised protein [Serratia entomophila]|jgi:hypothetical protein|nr:Uncharacterised protein [Serratia entomophila]CAI1569004.1 Uncharacterised protein [Serratia entomophila]
MAPQQIATYANAMFAGAREPPLMEQGYSGHTCVLRGLSIR